MKHAYLDYQSAKPVDPRVVDAMLPYFTEKFGNPSALHEVGDQATEALESSRKQILEFINGKDGDIVFTSGATESINLGIIGYVRRNRRKGRHIVISEIEHISIRNIAKYLESKGFSVSRVPVDQYGMVQLEKLERRLTDETILVSVGYANNEIGTIQPIKEIGEMTKERDIGLHTDAVAAEGLVDLDVERDNIDLMTLSSNDIYGPRGAGVLYYGPRSRPNPVMLGGGQEGGLRSGTENMPAIVGMSEAARIMEKEMDSEVKKLESYRDKLIDGVLDNIPDSHLNGHPTKRLANNAHFRFDGVEGEAILLSFKDKGISVSTGSACTSRTLQPSHTLIATGLLHEEAHGSLQFTVGRFTEDDDVKRALEATPEIITRLREMSPIYDNKEGAY
jgi:cysteine desulfurase